MGSRFKLHLQQIVRVCCGHFSLAGPLLSPTPSPPPAAPGFEPFGCWLKVFEQEGGMQALGGVWHSSCFVCMGCDASLSAGFFPSADAEPVSPPPRIHHAYTISTYTRVSKDGEEERGAISVSLVTLTLKPSPSP